MKLFVYGTLRVGGPLHEFWLGPWAHTAERGLTCGLLFDYGAYPIANLEADTLQSVMGEVFTVPEPHENQLIDNLIQMELGAGYALTTVSVQMLSGGEEKALAFTAAQSWVSRLPLVPNGDWIEYQEQLDKL